ncbi:MAG: HlyD family secretion protein [Planctomycetia bacterium]|nr:HlyD family secretion protein [Planctomycetia bacterium]
MSSEQQFDPNLIEQTKHQIRTLVNEITQLAKSDIPAEEFYSQFLERVVAAIAATGGVIWTFSEGSGLSLQTQINLRETGLGNDKEKMQEHSRLLYRALKHTEGLLVPPHSSTQEEDGVAGNPTGNLLILAPLLTDIELVGLVEIFQRPDTPVNTQRGYLRFLLQMCEQAVEFIKNSQLRHFSDRQMLWSQLEEFTRTIHESLDPKATAYTIANEGRRLIECDRVSVAIRYGSRCRVVAVSGQDLFDKRSNTIRLLNKLSTAVVAVEEPMWYTGDTSNFAPQVEKAVDAYVDESHSKAVAVIPLIPPLREEDREDIKKRQDMKRAPLGALIVEQIENSAVQTKLRQRVDVVAKHSCAAMANALEHNNLFLMPLWRAIGRWSWLVKARTLPKTITISILVLALFISLFIVPYKYEVNSDGHLIPEERQEVYANIDGDVIDVLVHHGDVVKGPIYKENIKLDEKGNPVGLISQQSHAAQRRLFDPDQYILKKGTPLVRLRNLDVSTQIVKLTGDINSTLTERKAVEGLLLMERGLSRQDAIRQAGRLNELDRMLEAYKKEAYLWRVKERNLNVCSPCDGVVVTFDVRENLINRPVQRGQVLMEIANPEGEWIVELYMPERRIGAIRLAQMEMEKKHPDGWDVPNVSEQMNKKYPKGLAVTYVLASAPETKLYGRIKEISKTAEVMEERGNVVKIKVALEENDNIQRNIGASVSGKVYCGTRPIGYVWFSDVIAFIRQKIIFRWF